MIKLINYSGTKIKYIDLINEHINRSNSKIYYEPFLGSGAVFFNLEKEFDEYHLNDIDKNMITMFRAFKVGAYDDFKYFEDLAINMDIKTNKENYYKFRTIVNNYRTIEPYMYGLGLYFLCNSCVNSMARFGPNGFNQSFGNRFKTLTKTEFDIIQSKLLRSKITNKSFFDLIIPTSDCLLFLDPPYIERPAAYSTISDDFFNNFIMYLKNTNNDFIYTDIDHDFLSFKKYTLRETMKNTAPSSKKENTNKEIMFINY